MALLLDTHAFVWFAIGSTKLSLAAKEAIQADPDISVSVASLWEMAVKHSLHRLEFIEAGFQEEVELYLRTISAKVLPISLEHIALVATLPMLHRDPFDRMLVAQAMHENIPLVSADEQLSRYACSVIW